MLLVEKNKQTNKKLGQPRRVKVERRVPIQAVVVMSMLNPAFCKLCQNPIT